MTRFSKVFQLLTVVLVLAIANVYVFAAPVRSTDPKKADAPETTVTKTDVASAEIATTAAPVAVAAEKLPLAPNAKIDFNRIFAKGEIKARASPTTSSSREGQRPATLQSAGPDRHGSSGSRHRQRWWR